MKRYNLIIETDLDILEVLRTTNSLFKVKAILELENEDF